MKNRTTPIILDRLGASLRRQGVELKRHQLLETAAAAFGYHNSGEVAAAAAAGDLDAPRVEVLGRVEIGDEALIVLRDVASGSPYAIDEDFVGAVVETERREAFGLSPYGGLVDLREVGSDPATAWAPKAGEAVGARYHSYREDGTLIGAHDDLDEAKAACVGKDGRSDLDAYVVDSVDFTLMISKHCWRAMPIVGVGPTAADRAGAAAALAVQRMLTEEAVKRHETTLRIDCPDWRAWERDLKKASHKRQDPVTDEILHQIRHACADVTSKDSAGDKAQVLHRQASYVGKHLGGLLARLDRAEEALREAGLAPAEIARKSRDDAAERLAAIEAVTAHGGARHMPGMYEVDATRDGDRCRETFVVGPDEDPEDRGRRIAAQAFRMDLEDYRQEDDQDLDDDGKPIPDYSDFDGECDTFRVEPVDFPEAAGVITDALIELSKGGDFTYGMPHSHPVRIKLIAAREMIKPKPTV